MINKVDLNNIYNENKLNKDSVEVLYDTLDNVNPYSLDIYNVYKKPNDKIAENIVKVYAEALYFGINKAISNPIIINKLKERIGESNEFSPFDLPAFYRRLIRDYFINFTNFKEKKGLDVAIEYAYNIMFTSGLQPGIDVNGPSGFDLKWGTEQDPDQPFFIRIEGLLDPMLYEGSVKSIAHPVGFGYSYVVRLILEFIDYIDDWFVFKIKKLAIVSINYIKSFEDKTVIDIETYMSVQGTERIVVTFENGEQLVKDFDGVITHKTKDNVILETWNNTYILQLDYDVELEFRLKDEFSNNDNNMRLYDCVWNEYTSEDRPIIGQITVGKFVVAGASKYYITIGDINDNTIYRLPNDDTKYTPDKMSEFLTNAINRDLFVHIYDEFNPSTTELFEDNVINEDGVINIPVIGPYLTVGKFTIGVQYNGKDEGAILEDLAVFTRETFTDHFKENVTKTFGENRFFTTNEDSFNEFITFEITVDDYFAIDVIKI
ncbi:putative baseplate wedge protein [Campylobacter phage F341]|nr:putative baseplate wedge protein [Campylobacter phage F341]